MGFSDYIATVTLTDYIAIYAAIVSTFVFLWNIRNEKSQIKVEIMYGAEEVDGKFYTGIYIIIKNLSQHKIYLNALSLAYMYKKISIRYWIEHFLEFRNLRKYIHWCHGPNLFYEDTNTDIPISIEPRSSISKFVPDNIVKEFLNDSVNDKLVAEVQTALGKSIYSPIFLYEKEGEDNN